MTQQKNISFTLNGEKRSFAIAPDEKLVKLLSRAAKLLDVKKPSAPRR